MTITWYLASACIMLAIICVLSYRLREINQTNKIKRIWSYAALLVVILGCISPMVLKKYSSPHMRLLHFYLLHIIRFLAVCFL